jgi:YVTN family beta-propeller protein
MSIAVDSNNNRIYVVNLFSTISVIDGKNDTVVKTIDLEEATDLHDIALNPNNNKIYVVSFAPDKLYVIDSNI